MDIEQIFKKFEKDNSVTIKKHSELRYYMFNGESFCPFIITKDIGENSLNILLDRVKDTIDGKGTTK